MLQAANVLMNDKIHCVITDFGQSEMKTEAFRMSGGKKSRKFVLISRSSGLRTNIEQKEHYDGKRRR